jgi:RES domain-containing protein
MQAWRIGTDTPTTLAEDMNGAGARISGGRWNRPGMAVVYSSESIALAAIETLVHLPSAGLPLNRYLVRIEIPEAIWKARDEITSQKAPVGWDALPVGKVSLDYGDDWIKRGRSAILVVPSIAVPEERNILINPAHPDSARITARKLRRWTYDTRLR